MHCQVEWHQDVQRNWRYNSFITSAQCTANCQDFTADLLKSMGISDQFNKDSKIKKFLDGIDQMEKNDVSFEYEFSDGEKFVFKSHTVLDSTCYEKVQ